MLHIRASGTTIEAGPRYNTYLFLASQVTDGEDSAYLTHPAILGMIHSKSIFYSASHDHSVVIGFRQLDLAS